jgi:putative OPT family oligopeptide transporter
MASNDFVPYIPPEEEGVPELTFKAMALGALLAIIMAAANAYLGLKAGMTVSAAIPASVISIAVFSALYKSGIIKEKATVLEVNVSKTSAAAGEALAAGIVFTLPALLVPGALELWDEVDLWATMGIALVGGLIGVIFTIPLRKVLIVDLDLPFPEGVACTEVILASEEGGKGGSYIARALGIGAIWQLARDSNGFRLFSPHFDITAGENVAGGKGRIWFGSELSAALVGVGYIIGPRVSLLVVLGGALGWLVIIPLIGLLGELGIYGDGWTGTGTDPFIIIWGNYLRYVGVGAMIVASLYTLISMRSALAQALAPVFDLFRKKDDDVMAAEPIRTEHDLPLGIMFGLAALLMIPTFFIYNYFAEDPLFSIGAAIMMIVAAFVFSSIAAYIAGILGSSSNPISGVTIATLALTSVLFMYGFGLEGDQGMLTAIGVAAVICVAAAIGGDTLQELKTGQLLGSTPKSLQKAEFIGVIAAGLTIPFVMLMLHEASGIGSRDLPAPQAYVMATIVDSIFNENMNWEMVILGGSISGSLILWNHYWDAKEMPQKKVPVMGVAVGVYLPFTTTFCIALGGILKYFSDRFVETNMRHYGEEFETEEEEEKAITTAKEEVSSDGILVASGLIAGEALMGVALAVTVFLNISLYDYFIGKEFPGKWHGLLAFMYLLGLIYYFGLRDYIKRKDSEEITDTFKEMLSEEKESWFGLKPGYGEEESED